MNNKRARKDAKKDFYRVGVTNGWNMLRDEVMNADKEKDKHLKRCMIIEKVQEMRPREYRTPSPYCTTVNLSLNDGKIEQLEAIT